jgi:hypothetical protein
VNHKSNKDKGHLSTEGSSESFIATVGSAVADKSYGQERMLSPEQRMLYKRMLLETILPSLSVSFSFHTNAFPKPIRVTTLMRRLSELLESVTPEPFFFGYADCD